VFDFVTIAFGKVCVCGGVTQVDSFLTFGLYQVGLHKTTYRFGVRASEIHRADNRRANFGIHLFIVSRTSANT
jgi:hypothetical protein